MSTDVTGGTSRRAPSARRTWQRRLRGAWRVILGSEWLWMSLFVLVTLALSLPSGLFSSHQVVAGDIAERDFVADRELLHEDKETTAARRQAARDEVLPIFDLDPLVTADRSDQILQLFEVGRYAMSLPQSANGAAAGPTRQSVLDEFLAASQVRLGPAQSDLLTELDYPAGLEERLRNVFSAIYRRGVVSNKTALLENMGRGVVIRDIASSLETQQRDLFRYLSYPDEVRELAESEVRRWSDLKPADRALLASFIVDNTVPNLTLNRSETRTRQEQAASAVVPVYQRLRSGQMIVRAGDEIDEVAASFINAMADQTSLVAVAGPTLGTLLILLIVTAGVWLALRRVRPPEEGCGVLVGGVFVILVLTVAGLGFGYLTAEALANFFDEPPFDAAQTYVWGIPFAAPALVAFLLYGRRVALLVALLSALLAGTLAPDSTFGVGLYAAVGAVGSVLFLDQIKQRSAITRAGLTLGVVNVLVVFALISQNEALALGGEQLLLSLAHAFAGGLIVAAVTSFVLPILEWLLGLTTDITLVELSNTNLPLLRQLAFDAPGTFQHSLMVANLAKAGCNVIGADGVLAYTCGLYHDIGKGLRPDYFIENQRPGHNPHDKLVPSLSALIVISHVKDGLEMAEDARLPKVIHNAIAQHHGTRVLTFFYERARSQSSDGRVEEDAYRYPGPKPKSKEMGVLMLADAVEAASRTLGEASALKIRTLVTKIFDSHLKDGQLDDAELTMADLKAISKEFRRVLETVFHSRVDYPGFDFNTQPKLRAVAGGRQG